MFSEYDVRSRGEYQRKYSVLLAANINENKAAIRMTAIAAKTIPGIFRVYPLNCVGLLLFRTVWHQVC